MSVFVDTGVFYAHHDTNAARHEAAVDGLERLFDGEFGVAYTSDYIIDEAVTLTRRQMGTFDDASTIADRILGTGEYTSFIECLYVDSDDLSAGLDTFRRYHDQELSFTDAVTITLCEQHDIDAVLSFDDDFDGLIERIEPRY
jgi:predicted nucleic acid-binding protein